MKKYTGMRAADGIAQGPARQIKGSKPVFNRYCVQDIQKEKDRLMSAKQLADEQLVSLCELAVHKLGEQDASVFMGWRMLLDDESLMQSVEKCIDEEKLNAEAAVHDVLEQYALVLGSAEEHYMRDRVYDIREVEERLLSALSGKERMQSDVSVDEPCVIVSEDITPEQMIRLDRKKILAFVMAGGSVRSHAAIMARIMGVPAVVSAGVGVLDIADGTWTAVDGYTGEIFTLPDEETRKRLGARAAQEEQRREQLKRLAGVAAQTHSGRRIKLLANISSEDELKLVEETGAEGVGLFRSEWLYLERSTYPSEEMQYIAYSRVLRAMKEKQVTIRTLDVGGDKKADYMHMRSEENPALGYRGIRVCLEEQDIFETQLRALYRASVHGNLAIMFPMIISLDEVRQIKEIVQKIQLQLTQQNIEFRQVRLGIMIETPAAALISDELAQEVDFFSIGTNDLTQYTLAVDRQNPQMEPYYNGTHRAVLRLVEMTVANAQKYGTEVCVCGELGADLTVTQQLLDMGIDVLSVNPSQLLALKERIISCE